LGEEHRLRVFENRVLRKISGPKREEDRSWRKFYNDEFHSLYFSPNIVRMIKSRRMRWAGHVARMGEGRVVYRFLAGRSEGKRPLGRPRRRWKDNIKMDLREIGIDGANWIQLAQHMVQWRAFVNTVMNLRVP
jgi:transcription termination factor 2